MKPSNTIPLNELIKIYFESVWAVDQKCREYSSIMREAYEHNNDLRAHYFIRLQNSAYLQSVIYNYFDEDHKNGWSVFNNMPFDGHEIHIVFQDYIKRTGTYFSFDFYTLTELALRRVAKEVFPQANHEKISIVYKKLAKITGLDSQEVTALKLLFYTRNSIHNAGIQSKSYPTVNYKGVEYKFIEGKYAPTHIATQKILYCDVVDILFKIFNNPAVLNKRYIGLVSNEENVFPIFD